jgi:hypothetical protein
MLKRITIIANAALFSLSACNRLSPNEQKVVGTWEAPGGFGPRCIFRADHTSETLFLGKDGKWVVMSEGTWRLEGNAIDEDFKFISPAPDPGETPRIFKGRTRVIEFQKDKLVMETLEQSLFRVK